MIYVICVAGLVRAALLVGAYASCELIDQSELEAVKSCRRGHLRYDFRRPKAQVR